ncbi:MAG: hypothetical protein ACXW16_06150 [Burkholderiaceae bacterium]
MPNLNALFATLSFATFLGFTSTGAEAGPYADDLGKCLVKSTTSADKRALVKWMFATASLHPDIQPIAAVSAQQRDSLNKAIGALFDRLLTQTCSQQAIQAFNFEGGSTIEYSFQILGQVAARELFADSAVVAGMANMTKHAESRNGATVGGKTVTGSRIVAAPSGPSKVRR